MQKNSTINQKPPQTPPKAKVTKVAKNSKEAQLAAALRANILKRKAALKKRDDKPVASNSAPKI